MSVNTVQRKVISSLNTFIDFWEDNQDKLNAAILIIVVAVTALACLARNFSRKRTKTLTKKEPIETKEPVLTPSPVAVVKEEEEEIPAPLLHVDMGEEQNVEEEEEPNLYDLLPISLVQRRLVSKTIRRQDRTATLKKIRANSPEKHVKQYSDAFFNFMVIEKKLDAIKAITSPTEKAQILFKRAKDAYALIQLLNIEEFEASAKINSLKVLVILLDLFYGNYYAIDTIIEILEKNKSVIQNLKGESSLLKFIEAVKWKDMLPEDKAEIAIYLQKNYTLTEEERELLETFPKEGYRLDWRTHQFSLPKNNSKLVPTLANRLNPQNYELIQYKIETLIQSKNPQKKLKKKQKLELVQEINALVISHCNENFLHFE